MSPAIVLRADARSLPLPDASVDLIVTSPPYFALRSYRDGGEHYDGQVGAEPTPQGFLESLWTVTAECWRVLKPSGSMFVNLGDKRSGSGGHNNAGISSQSTLRGNGHVGGGPKIKATLRGGPDRYNQAAFGRKKSKMLLPHRYAIGCEDGAADPEGIGWIVRQDLVWSKTNGLPESVQDRTRDAHEYWFHLTKEERYFAALDEIRVPHADGSLSRIAAGFSVTKHDHASADHNGAAAAAIRDGGRRYVPNTRGVIPSSVWTMNMEPLQVPEWLEIDHTAAFPSEWPRRLILGWCPPDGVVLDPFGGTGTTAMVARALGRIGISVDLSADYCRLARWRIFESGHGAKAIARTHRDRQGVLL